MPGGGELGGNLAQGSALTRHWFGAVEALCHAHGIRVALVQRRSEALSGLARAFFYAGARALGAPVTVPGEPKQWDSPASGFVVVLASKRSRTDALKAIAELQQKYPEVLAGKTPDVWETNLGDKGVWYRAGIGPPGPREAATSVCSDLKTAGHAGCWVAAY
jgi:hypothetical protein